MKPHKKLPIAFASAVLAAASLSSQEKVAVLPPQAGRNVSEMNKKTVRSAFLDHISEHGSGFAAFDRHIIDTMIQREPGRQQNTLYNEKAARDIGRKLGVPLVCIIDLTRGEHDFLIECKLVWVDTGRAVSKSGIASGLTNAEIKRASEAVIQKLMPGEPTIVTPSAPKVSAAVRAEPPSRAAAQPSHGHASKSPKEPKKSVKPSHGSEWSYGASLHLVNPGGDLTNDRLFANKVTTGFGLSAFGEFGLNDMMALCGRVDYNIFGEGKLEGSEYSGSYKFTHKLNASVATVFGDYTYGLDSHEKGLYVFAGLGFVRGKLEEEWKAYRGGTLTEDGHDSESGIGLGFSLGVGYNFSNSMGVEASYVTAGNVIVLKNSLVPYGFTWLQASFKYRF